MFIQDILRDPNFTEDERSLLIVCEEGIEEYDPQLLHDARTEIVMVEDASELTLRFFRDLGKKFNPDRVLIELNGMWEIGDFLEGKLPPEWPLYRSSPRSMRRPSSCIPTTSARVCSSRFPWPI